MEAISYLIKANLAIVLFYGCYRLFFQRDTFFQWKRIVFLFALAFSLIYPFSNIHTKWAKDIQSTPVFTKGINMINLPEIIVSPQKMLSEADQLLIILTTIYVIVCIVFLIRMIVQILNIVIKIYRSEKIKISGVNIHVLKGIQAPFSFFRWIVLDPDIHNKTDLQEIILHEKTHATQYHSLDVIFYESVLVFCWFNPILWWMKREVRMNLEFLADRSVVSSGYCSEHYQLHLLRLSYHKAIAQLTNNFNVSPLKKRIRMMNKKKTPWINRAKYLLFLPLVGVLLFTNNSIAQDVIQKTASPGNDLPELATLSYDKHVPQEKVQDKKSDEQVYEHVEQMPEFPGGEKELLKYLSDNINYPAPAQKNGLQGTVRLRFIINPKGSVTNVQVVESLDPACDKEAVRVIKAMPKWTPGKQDGKFVSVYYNVPIRFRLAN